jgi:hypothetical protein
MTTEEIGEASTAEPAGEARGMSGQIGYTAEPPAGSSGALAEDDDLVATLPPGLKREGCKCVTEHRPAVVGTDFHHVVPRAWGGPDVAENIVELCPTTHRSLHDLLRWAVRNQAWPPRAVLYRYPRYVRQLGARAVREYGGIPPRHLVPREFGGHAE